MAKVYCILTNDGSNEFLTLLGTYGQVIDTLANVFNDMWFVSLNISDESAVENIRTTAWVFGVYDDLDEVKCLYLETPEWAYENSKGLKLEAN